MPTVAITDFTFPDLEVEKRILQSAGLSVVSDQCRTPETVASLIADVDYVITQFAPVTAAAIEAMKNARIIVRYGVGYDNVDLDAARKREIPVCNIPGFCTDEVAEHTVAFILATTRCVKQNDARVQSGQWGLGVTLEDMKSLRDMTIGVVGLGRIGRGVVERLTPFKCRLLVFDPVVPPDQIEQLGATSVTLQQLFSESDLVTLHCPSTDQTRGLINTTTLAQIKPGAILINLGRGDLVNSDDLATALDTGQIRAAALDVFETEPLPSDSRLRGRDNVILASHISSASVSAQRTLRESAANLVVMRHLGEPLPNIVNGVEPS